jgi:hypothetical protein
MLFLEVIIMLLLKKKSIFVLLVLSVFHWNLFSAEQKNLKRSRNEGSVAEAPETVVTAIRMQRQEGGATCMHNAFIAGVVALMSGDNLEQVERLLNCVRPWLNIFLHPFSSWQSPKEIVVSALQSVPNTSREWARKDDGDIWLERETIRSNKPLADSLKPFGIDPENDALFGGDDKNRMENIVIIEELDALIHRGGFTVDICISIERVRSGEHPQVVVLMLAPHDAIAKCYESRQEVVDSVKKRKICDAVPKQIEAESACQGHWIMVEVFPDGRCFVADPMQNPRVASLPLIQQLLYLYFEHNVPSTRELSNDGLQVDLDRIKDASEKMRINYSSLDDLFKRINKVLDIYDRVDSGDKEQFDYTIECIWIIVNKIRYGKRLLGPLGVSFGDIEKRLPGKSSDRAIVVD